MGSSDRPTASLVPQKDNIPNIDIKDGDDEIKIGFDGIEVKEKDGDHVKIDLSGIKVKEKDGTDLDATAHKLFTISVDAAAKISGVER